MLMNYAYKKKLNFQFNEAIERVKQELAEEGFGVLTEIDVKTTMKKKLSVDYDNYIILGACNPKLAHEALSIEKEVGLFLPCNVIVYEDGDTVFATAILPLEIMSIAGSSALNVVAEKAEKKLKNVIDSL